MLDRRPAQARHLLVPWSSSRARGFARGAVLRTLALIPRTHVGVSHVFLHAMPEENHREFAHLLDEMESIAPIISMAEGLARQDSGNQCRAFTISFDDGYRTAVTSAAGMLAQRGIAATYFVPSGFIGLEGPALEEYMRNGLRWDVVIPPASADQVAKCAELGHEIGSHGVSHRSFAGLNANQAREELVESRKALEAIVNKPVRYFAWPFGALKHFRPEYADLARSLGYDRVFSAAPRREVAKAMSQVVSRRALDLSWGVPVCIYLATKDK